MTSIHIFIITSLIVLWFLVIAVNIANHFTFKQRMKLIDEAYSYPYDEEKMNKLRSVSYRKHMWYLITLRNPRKLYW